jgi:hypothetical protein
MVLRKEQKTKMNDSEFNFKDNLDNIKGDVDRVEEEQKTLPYDQTKFNAYAALPENVPVDIINLLADLFDDYEHFDHGPDDNNKQIGPNTVDKIMQSIAVAYITKDGIPVAGATLLDPTVQNYKGIIPKDYYELKSGISLNGRIMQEFFEVSPDAHNLGLAQELKSVLENIAPKMFVVVASNEKDTLVGLNKNRYMFVAEFDTEWENVPVQLWIN